MDVMVMTVDGGMGLSCVGGYHLQLERLGQPGFQMRGGAVDRAPWLDPPLPKKGLN